jgi:DNA-binding transcriptional regulator of glucitol operon
VLHVAVVAASVTMVRLGQWQWHQAHRHHGEILNYSYAFQWWAFAGFTILMWLRVIRDQVGVQAPTLDEGRAASGPPARYVAYQPPPSQPAGDDDPERARFNAYLTSLYAADREDTG